MIDTAYYFAEPSTYTVAVVERHYGAMAREMPPIVVAFLCHVFNGGGWPLRHEGARWRMDTPLQRVELHIIDTHRAQLQVWARHSGPEFERPPIDRTVYCYRKEKSA